MRRQLQGERGGQPTAHGDAMRTAEKAEQKQGKQGNGGHGVVCAGKGGDFTGFAVFRLLFGCKKGDWMDCQPPWV